jgi:hypothetical protein
MAYTNTKTRETEVEEEVREADPPSWFSGVIENLWPALDANTPRLAFSMSMARETYKRKESGKGYEKRISKVRYKVTLWREEAQKAGQHLQEGQYIMVAGYAAIDTYTDKDGIEQKNLIILDPQIDEAYLGGAEAEPEVATVE